MADKDDPIRKITLGLRQSLIDELRAEHRRTYPQHGKPFAHWIADVLRKGAGF